MPTYQYRCTDCGNELEAVQKFSDPALTECPTCTGQLRKVFNAVGVVFKGSGFYRTDSRNDKKSPGSANGSSSESGSAAKSDSGASGGSANGSGADTSGGKQPATAGSSSGAGGSGSSSSSGGSSTGSSGGSSTGS